MAFFLFLEVPFSRSRRRGLLLCCYPCGGRRALTLGKETGGVDNVLPAALAFDSVLFHSASYAHILLNISDLTHRFEFWFSNAFPSAIVL